MKPLNVIPATLLLILACLPTYGLSQADSQATDKKPTPQAVMPAKYAAVFKKYCYECHDTSSQEGNIDLEKIPFKISTDIPTAERWSKILNAINSGEMPPPDSKPISDKDKTAFLADLSIEMVRARKILSDSGGVITLRRLNRREYQNTIEALLGVKIDVSHLPDDQASSDFDTTGASLFFSSDQLELYLATAKSSLELAFREPTSRKSKTVRVEPEKTTNPFYAKAAEEMRDRVARSQAYFAQKEAEGKPPSDFGFLDEYQAKRQRVAQWLPQFDQYFERPETKTGVTLIVTIKQGGPTKVKLPTIGPKEDGRYTIRLRAAHYPNADERFHYLEFTSGMGTGRKRLGWRKVTATLDNPEVIEFPIKHRPGQKLQYWIHQRTHQDRGDKNLATIHQKANGIGTTPGIWVDWAELEGPHPKTSNDDSKQSTSKKVGAIESNRPGTNHVSTANIRNPIHEKKPVPSARERFFFAKPSDWTDEQYAREVLHRFALRAFRDEEPAPKFLDRLVDQYTANRQKGLSRNQALIGPMSIVLASPSFLYMVESTGNASSPLLKPNELATRLSYLIWSAPPDDELIELARSGKLTDSAVLKEQTTRLLNDEKADRFVRSFVHQWLQMERLGMFQFMGRDFPTFDNAARESAREEVFQTFHLLLKEKLPLSTLLKSDFVVINDLLAGYYGIKNVKGHQFRKVKLPKDSLRGGLLGTAAVLAMGSDGLKSSPVERGAWVLRNLVNDPPPPAPPNVPQLSRLDGQAFGARDLQKAHQERPQCAQCHQKIDPIGYALENFSAAGLWRDKETIAIGKRKSNKTKEFAIDPSGQLPSGEKFDGYAGLRDAVSKHSDDFARGFTEALIEYGLGRPYGFTDQDLADELMKKAEPSDYEISEFIHALVQSRQFRTK